MPETIVPKHTLVGVGYAEMCQDGRRYRFKVERYRHDDGSEWGRIVERQEIPDIGPQLWIPSYGVESPAEAQYLAEEWEYEKSHPHPLDQEFWSQHRDTAKKQFTRYNELRDERAAHIKRHPVTKGRG